MDARSRKSAQRHVNARRPDRKVNSMHRIDSSNWRSQPREDSPSDGEVCANGATTPKPKTSACAIARAYPPVRPDARRPAEVCGAHLRRTPDELSRLRGSIEQSSNR
eukprot:6200192-Pleurochrysis_carterae.AAC.1